MPPNTRYNWNTLNKKVLRRLGFQLHPDDIDDMCKAVPGACERVLVLVQHYMAKYLLSPVFSSNHTGGGSNDV